MDVSVSHIPVSVFFNLTLKKVLNFSLKQSNDLSLSKVCRLLFKAFGGKVCN